MEERSKARPWTFAVMTAVVLGLLAAPASSVADPGRPGLAQASQAVYPSQQAPANCRTLARECDSGTGAIAGETASGGGSEQGGGVSGATAGSEAVSGDAGLPFTGLAAPLMLMAALAALGLGIAFRVGLVASRRPRSSASL